MISLLLLLAITLLYAGYNLFIKVSGGQVPVTATTAVTATICLQLAALLTSLLFFGALVVRGGHVFALSTPAYLWAIAAGLCIGGAEIAYFYLFGGIGGVKPMAASVAIPVIVSGTIVVTLLVSSLAFGESVGWHQLLGCALIVLGIVLLFGKGSA